MKQIKIDWDSLLLAYESEFQGFEMKSFLDMTTGEIDTVEWNFGDEEPDDNLLCIPSRNSRDDYRAMEAFIDTIGNPKVRNKLSNAISGKGAFRRFKDALYDYPDEQQRWYQYLENRHIGELLEWLEEYDLEPESIPGNNAVPDNVIYISQAAVQKDANSRYVTDPKEAKRLAEKKLDENYDFRSYIKGYLKWNDKKLDATVHEILMDVKKYIDCSKCRNCCIESTASMETDEISGVAAKLGMSVDDFSDKFLTKNHFGNLVANETPCPFFKDMNCILGDSKPDSCKEFPFLHRDEFRSRSLGVVANTVLCPIVYNVIEELKAEVGWRKKKSK